MPDMGSVYFAREVLFAEVVFEYNGKYINY